MSLHVQLAMQAFKQTKIISITGDMNAQIKCVSYRSQHLNTQYKHYWLTWKFHLRQHLELSTSSIVLSIVIADIVSVDQKAKRNN